jgi:hypothetical protein
LAGGLVFLMATMILVFAIAMASIVRTVRRERAAGIHCAAAKPESQNASSREQAKNEDAQRIAVRRS